MITEKKREANRKSQEKYRNTDKGKAYMDKWREDNREKYLAYQREYHRKKNEKNN